MMELEPVVTLDSLGTVGGQLGKGGQATVFELEADADTVLKLYNPALPIEHSAIDVLIDWRLGLSGDDRENLDARTCWPQARVVQDETTVGVVLRRAPERFLVTLKSGNIRLRELQYLFLVDRSRKIGVDVPEPLVRTQLVGQLAELFAFLQDHEVVHGDLSMKNVLWAPPESDVAAVYLLDCDGARVAGSSPPLPQVTTPGWTDPRLINGEIKVPDPASDVYGLGLCFYRCYYGFLGEHDPSSSTLRLPEWPPVDARLANLAARTLSPRAGRPSAIEWVEALTDLLEDLSDETSEIGATYLRGDNQTTTRDEGATTINSAPPAGATSSVERSSTTPAVATGGSGHSVMQPPTTAEAAAAGTSHLAKLFLAVSIGLLAGAVVALIVVLAVLR